MEDFTQSFINRLGTKECNFASNKATSRSASVSIITHTHIATNYFFSYDPPYSRGNKRSSQNLRAEPSQLQCYNYNVIECYAY